MNGSRQVARPGGVPPRSAMDELRGGLGRMVGRASPTMGRGVGRMAGALRKRGRGLGYRAG